MTSMRPTNRWCFRLAIYLAAVFCNSLHPAEPPTGPATEKRFPPLKVPPGFKATLFACDPFIEYPSVIAIGPKKGSLFIGVDYMTGLGTDGVVKSEVRLIEDTDGDGYADKSTVFAKGFNSIEGLAYHNGTVYVMHAPFLTALRDTKGTGVADERKDLLEGLGLTPEKNPVRLHCANGVVPGHDGWLYLAMGDHGVDVKRPEGDRLVLNGGGILRCRKDGTDLHIFATGTRNIYDVSLDEDLNVFFRDNENDGGDYKIRVCHSFFGADHGYPYHYYERPDEAMPPLADLGLGSSAGGVCYLETQFPAEYRGNLFNCEWGKSVVRCVPKREGSGFAQLKEIEFATGADDDPYGFKPTDLVVDRDGSLFVSDWADGQRPKRSRGRIYRITYAENKKDSKSERTEKLDSESYFERCETQENLERLGAKDSVLSTIFKTRSVTDRERMHMVWVLAHTRGPKAIDELFELSNTSFGGRVHLQIVRALADLTDPVLVQHKLDAGPGDSKIAERMSKITGFGFNLNDKQIQLEVVIALGRLSWADSPAWLQKNIIKPDATLAHAAMMTLRKSGNWPEVLKLLDLPSSEPMRAIALRAIAEQPIAEIADGLIARLKTEKDPSRRKEYADCLTRIHRKLGPWTYWGYRPPPRPANTMNWEKTSAIELALNDVLSDPGIRLSVVRRMYREKVPSKLRTLKQWLLEETNDESLLAILDTLREHSAVVTLPLLSVVVIEKQKPTAVRLEALKLFAAGLDEKSEEQLLALAKSLEHGPVLAEALRLLVKRPKLDSAKLLIDRVASYSELVRAAAIEGIGDLKVAEGAKRVTQRLEDRDPIVRRAAAAAAGKLNLVATAETLLKLARDPDAGVRRASLDSLRLLKERKAVPLAVNALNDPETQLAALMCITELGGPEQSKALIEVARVNPSMDVLPLVIRALTNWKIEDAVADLHGSSGVLVRWRADGPFFGAGLESRIRLPVAKNSDAHWQATSELTMPEKTEVQFLVGTNAAFRLLLNGKQIHQRGDVQPSRIDAERFDAVLEKGTNRVTMDFADAKADIDFHLRFRRKSAVAAHEKLTQAALARNGNVENGRKLFLNVERTQCMKCHRIGEQGEKIGPELTGIGSRFSRIHLVESILEPSRTIASSFQTLVIAMNDGRQLIGIKIAETETLLTLADKEGKKTELKKVDIESQRVGKLSVMPEGLEKSLSTGEFVDLISYLVSLKDTKR